MGFYHLFATRKTNRVKTFSRLDSNLRTYRFKIHNKYFIVLNDDMHPINLNLITWIFYSRCLQEVKNKQIENISKPRLEPGSLIQPTNANLSANRKQTHRLAICTLKCFKHTFKLFQYLQYIINNFKQSLTPDKSKFDYVIFYSHS